MLGLPFHRAGAGQNRNRVHQFRRRIGRAAGLAAVSILIGRAAARTGAAHETVGQEHAFLFVVGLADGPALQMPTALQAPIDQVDQLPILARMGAAKIVEADVEGSEIFLEASVVVFDDLFRRDPVLARADHDRRAMGVAGADKQAIVAEHALEAHPDVGLDVLHQMPHMGQAVGIGQGGGDEDTTAVGHATGSAAGDAALSHRARPDTGIAGPLRRFRFLRRAGGSGPWRWRARRLRGR